MSVTGQSNTAMELIIVATIALSACSPAEEGAAPGAADAIGEQQTVSLFGERLYAQIDTTGAIAEADAALAAAPAWRSGCLSAISAERPCSEKPTCMPSTR